MDWRPVREVSVAQGWQGRLALRFERCAARTELVQREHVGPLRVQRPFYPEADGVCHVYVLHPPGGVVGGDGLELDVGVASGAHALLTTPAATKLYRSGSARAAIRQTLRVASGGSLEWLPQETIAFSAAQVDLLTRVELAPGARWIGWEILCLGRPASGETFESGQLRQRIEVVRDGALRYCERGSYAAGSAVLEQPWGLAGQPVVGTMLGVGRELNQHVEPLRAALAEVAPPSQAAVSCMGDICVARYLGPSTEQAKACFARVWEVMRPLLFERRAEPPRIWAT